MGTVKIARSCMVLLFLMVLITVPAAASADSDIAVKIYDPDKGYDSNDEDRGNDAISYSALSVPAVTFGDNRELGTFRVQGKEGVLPLSPGQKVKVELPLGTCYMQAPTADSYKMYVTWPESLPDGGKNQIRDDDNLPGIKFLEGTPRSLTVEIGKLDSSGEMMVFDFIFDQENYSTVRISRLIDEVKSLEADPDGKISRLDFFKLLADTAVPFPTFPLDLGDDSLNPSEIFSDLSQVAEKDIRKISPLVNAGLIVGYPDKRLGPNDYITGTEAANLIGKIFPSAKTENGFTGPLPEWAQTVVQAIHLGIVNGDTFRPDAYVTKEEALNMLQRTMECYQVKSALGSSEDN